MARCREYDCGMKGSDAQQLLLGVGCDFDMTIYPAGASRGPSNIVTGMTMAVRADLSVTFSPIMSPPLTAASASVFGYAEA